MGNGFEEVFYNSGFGAVKYKVLFTEIRCARVRFMNPDKTADLDDLELYGLAIYAAKKIKAQGYWLLTGEGHLISASTDKDVPTIKAVLDIERQLNFLSTFAFTVCRGGIEPNRPISRVSIPDLPGFNFGRVKA